MRILTSATIAATFIAVLAACGSASGPTATPVRTVAPTAPPTAAPTAPGGIPTSAATFQGGQGGADVGGTFTLVIEGGALAGTYTSNEATGACVVSAGNLTLSLEAAGLGPSGEGVYVSTSGLLAQVTAGTGEFQAAIAFGDGAVVIGYPAPSGKDGNLKADDRGTSFTFEMNGSMYAVNAAGSFETLKVRLNAECTQIIRQ